mmetsp:Transcript_40181/g.79423  ORF Transcript_40181/g.79423 Transcript_40181/m.79423 type:complete len:138 (-) Transcript_40181:176-589(-)
MPLPEPLPSALVAVEVAAEVAAEELQLVALQEPPRNLAVPPLVASLVGPSLAALASRDLASLVALACLHLALASARGLAVQGWLEADLAALLYHSDSCNCKVVLEGKTICFEDFAESCPTLLYWNPNFSGLSKHLPK